jgi:hypothetical protein
MYFYDPLRLCISYAYIYMHIYIERKRDRKREGWRSGSSIREREKIIK